MPLKAGKRQSWNKAGNSAGLPLQVAEPKSALAGTWIYYRQELNPDIPRWGAVTLTARPNAHSPEILFVINFPFLVTYILPPIHNSLNIKFNSLQPCLKSENHWESTWVVFLWVKNRIYMIISYIIFMLVSQVIFQIPSKWGGSGKKREGLSFLWQGIRENFDSWNIQEDEKLGLSQTGQTAGVHGDKEQYDQEGT